MDTPTRYGPPGDDRPPRSPRDRCRGQVTAGRAAPACDTGGVEGYDSSTYGDRFAEVYDDWYGSITDTEASITALRALAGDGPVLELGVGTGRLAVPLAAGGLEVTGVDASAAMLDALAAKPGGERVTAVLGDMAEPALDRRFSLVFVAYNTLFNLIDPGAQQRCIANAAATLSEGGRLLVEAFVPDPDHQADDAVTPREITADRVVLSVSRSAPDRQEIEGQYVDISAAGIALRPWHIRWATVAQLDEMAAAAGLSVEQRWSTWTGEAFHTGADRHISCYRPA